MSKPITYDVGDPPRSLSEFSDGIKKHLAFLREFATDEPSVAEGR